MSVADGSLSPMLLRLDTPSNCEDLNCSDLAVPSDCSSLQKLNFEHKDRENRLINIPLLSECNLIPWSVQAFVAVSYCASTTVSL